MIVKTNIGKRVENGCRVSKGIEYKQNFLRKALLNYYCCSALLLCKYQNIGMRSVRPHIASNHINMYYSHDYEAMLGDRGLYLCHLNGLRKLPSLNQSHPVLAACFDWLIRLQQNLLIYNIQLHDRRIVFLCLVAYQKHDTIKYPTDGDELSNCLPRHSNALSRPVNNNCRMNLKLFHSRILASLASSDLNPVIVPSAPQGSSNLNVLFQAVENVALFDCHLQRLMERNACEMKKEGREIQKRRSVLNFKSYFETWQSGTR